MRRRTVWEQVADKAYCNELHVMLSFPMLHALSELCSSTAYGEGFLKSQLHMLHSGG